MNPFELAAETRQLITEAQRGKLGIKGAGSLYKALTTSSNLVNIDLQAVAKRLIPVITPLRNRFNRQPGRGGLATQWRAVTGINTNNIDPGIPEGQRNADSNIATTSYLASYKTLGHENYVTFEEEEAAEQFDNALSISTETTLWTTMISEERTLLGGNTSLALGTTGNVTLAGIDDGKGALVDGTYRVNCVALTHDGWFKLQGSALTTITASLTQTGMDGLTFTVNNGLAIKGTTQTVTLSAGTSTQGISAGVPLKQGAVAYLWFLGQTNDAGTYAFAVTTVNSIKIYGPVATGNQALGANFAADYSQNANVFDGLISLICGAGQQNPGVAASGALIVGQTAGTTLTSDGAAGIVEIKADFKSFWDKYRLGPTRMQVGSGTKDLINKLIIGNGGAPLVRFNSDANDASQTRQTYTGGVEVGEIKNPFALIGNKMVKVDLHPNMPDGMIVYECESIPYPLGTNVGNPAVVETRKEYYQTDWPRRTRRYEHGVYVTEVLTHYAPFSLGMRYNITV